MRVPILKADVLNENGRVYTIDVLREIKKHFTEKFGKIYMDNIFPLNLGELSHECKSVELIGDTLYGEIQILDNDNGKKLKSLLETKSVVFRTAGTGKIDENGRVFNYELNSVNAVSKETDAFKNFL